MKALDRRFSIILHDLFMVALAWLVAYSIRQDSIGTDDCSRPGVVVNWFVSGYVAFCQYS